MLSEFGKSPEFKLHGRSSIIRPTYLAHRYTTALYQAYNGVSVKARDNLVCPELS